MARIEPMARMARFGRKERIERMERTRSAGAIAAWTAVALSAALTGCRARPTPSIAPPPTSPPPTPAAPLDVGGASAATAVAPDPAAGATPLPSPTTLVPIEPLMPIEPKRTSPPSASATPAASFPIAAILIGKRLEGGAVGSVFHLADVRTGEHPGYTRIVWAMDEAAGAPRWTTLLRRDVEGTAVIDVALSDVSAFAKPETLAAQSPQSPIVDSIRQQRVADDAELRFAVRLARPAGYRVTVIEGPVRVVLDVAHEP